MRTGAKVNPPFRADVVGSLLRPQAIHDARKRRERGEISADELRRIEDACVREAVAMQRDVGLKVATDGEFHRRHWFLDFLERIDGIEVKGGLPIKFHNEKGEIEFAPPRFEVTGKVRRTRGLATDDYASLHAIATGVLPKQPIPSPMCVHFRGGRAAVAKSAYPDIDEFFADLARVYRQEIKALYDLGCRYLQIDDTNLPFLCDPALRDHVRKIGENPDELPKLYVRLMNEALAGRPRDMVVVMHMCRGNHASSWIAEGGYDPIAEIVFGSTDVDGYFLEYDSPRAGGFAPLRYLPADKVAVLGLITTKRPHLEPKDEIRRRIEEAGRYVPIERLALSPQCGFASTIAGNALTIEDEKRKLRHVVEVAAEIWH